MTRCADCLDAAVELFPTRLKGFSGRERDFLLCAGCREERKKPKRRPKTEAQIEEEKRIALRVEERMRSRSAPRVIKGPIPPQKAASFVINPSQDCLTYMTSKGTVGYRLAFMGWKWLE